MNKAVKSYWMLFASMSVGLFGSKAYGDNHTKESDSKRPNILILLADDMGYGELGCYGQQVIQTPNIDKLAEGGVQFSQFYAGNTVSSPSRASLLTGKHSGHCTIRGNSGYFGQRKWDRVPLKKEELTLAEMLKHAGYYTGFVGKWHVEDPNDLSTWAFARGFDYSVQVQWSSPFGGERYNEDVHWINAKEDSVTYQVKENDCIDSFRLQFVKQFFERKENTNPFFLFMSYRSPHAREQEIRDKATYSEHNWPEVERVHATRITMLDREVGKTLHVLDSLGVLDNTIVLFLSDNGAHREGGHDLEFFASTGGLRGYKRELYEGGIRVPFIVSWPNKIKGGKITNHIAAFWDVMPTLADVAGISIPKQTDGISFLPTLLGEKQRAHAYLYWEFQLDGTGTRFKDGGFRQAVRKGDWKFVKYGRGGENELYHLKSDLFETINVAAFYPEVVKEMLHIIDEAHTETAYYPYGGIF